MKIDVKTVESQSLQTSIVTSLCHDISPTSCKSYFIPFSRLLRAVIAGNMCRFNMV